VRFIAEQEECYNCSFGSGICGRGLFGHYEPFPARGPGEMD